MSALEFWFWRPFGEALANLLFGLGVMFIILVIVVLAMIADTFRSWRHRREIRRKLKEKQ